MAVKLSAENFEREVLQSDVPVLVDFWAQWCGPCQMIAPVIDELSKDMEGKAKICKLNVDEVQEIAARYGVMSIPTLIVFNEGQVVKQTVGVNPKEKLVALLEPYIK